MSNKFTGKAIKIDLSLKKNRNRMYRRKNLS